MTGHDISNVLTACKDLADLGALATVRNGKENEHRLTKVGRKLIAQEIARIDADVLRLVGVARLGRYARLSLLDQIEQDLRGV